jgi:hypothetical protein
MIRNANPYPDTPAARDQKILLEGLCLDGNRANNGGATQFAHGIQLYAVDGVRLDVWIVNPHGDGVSIQQAYAAKDVGCSNVTGKIRTSGCARDGLAITCGEQIDLDVYDTGSDLMSVNLEADNPINFIRNIFIRVLSVGTGNGTDVSGGVTVAGDGAGCAPMNVTIDFQVLNSRGQGAVWRDVKGLILRGTIENPALNGLVGLDAGVVPSRVFFDGVRIFSAHGNGMVARETAGAVYDGEVMVEEAAGTGVYIANAQGGKLGLSVKNSGQQGIVLSDVHNMTFPSTETMGNSSHNLWLANQSTGNRFQFLKSVGSNWGWGFLEDAGCNDNRAFYARVSGNSAGDVQTKGALSSVRMEG